MKLIHQEQRWSLCVKKRSKKPKELTFARHVCTRDTRITSLILLAYKLNRAYSRFFACVLLPSVENLFAPRPRFSKGGPRPVWRDESFCTRCTSHSALLKMFVRRSSSLCLCSWLSGSYGISMLYHRYFLLSRRFTSLFTSIRRVESVFLKDI